MLKGILSWINAGRNLVDYPLRQYFHWRRGGLQITNEPKDDLFAHLPQDERSRAVQTEARLRETYHLEPFFKKSKADNYRENLFYLEFIEHSLNAACPTLPQSIIAADIGPSDWFYVQALIAALKWWQCRQGREIKLTGFERDAYRVYADFHSRMDHANAHMRGAAGVRYLPQAFKPQPGTYDVIVMLFPFIFLSDHLKWGLPLRLFAPKTLLEAALASLKPEGVLIIANQGLAEHQQQLKYLEELSVSPKATLKWESNLYHYDIARFLIVAGP